MFDYGIIFSMNLFCLAESASFGSTCFSILFRVIPSCILSGSITEAGVTLQLFPSSLLVVFLFVVEFLPFADFALVLLFTDALP
jgi:hypothetical protein